MGKKADDANCEIRKGVIYARYSSRNQKEESIEQQIAECMDFAEQNGIQIIHTYADKAISGRTDKRPQFQRMMRDAEKRDFTVVLAYKSNRIARNMLNALKYEDQLGKFGIETLYAKEEFGNTAAGRFALRTMMNINQFYSENLAEDVKRGMRDNAEACKVNGVIPFGYVRGADGRLAIEPREAALVREIYERVLGGETYSSIGDDFNARGIRTKREKPWTPNSFRKILRNDAYIGVYRHSGVVKENGVPPILRQEVFEAMQKHMESRKKTKARSGGKNCDYLLTGKLFCGHCNSPMVGISCTGGNGKVYYYYSCNTSRTTKMCDKKNARKSDVERTVLTLTQQIILQDEIIEWLADSAMVMLGSPDRKAEIAEMKATLKERKKAAKNVMAAIEQGIITETTKARLMELEEEIADLEKSIAKEQIPDEDMEKVRAQIVFALQKLKDGDLEDTAFQKSLISTFVKAVYLWDDDDGGKIEIDYDLPGKNNIITRKLRDFRGKPDVDSSQFRITHNGGIPNTLIRTINGRKVVISFTESGFVLLSPLFVMG